MLLRGTEKYNFTQINEILEAREASRGFDGGRHITQCSGDCLVEDIDLIFDLMSQALSAPVFAESQFERVRGQMKQDYISKLKIPVEWPALHL